MKRSKKVNTYFSILIITIFVMIFTACGVQDEEDIQQPSETYSCSVQELSSYLHGYETDCPYISADITINNYSVEPLGDDYWNWNLSMTSGDAEVTWQFYDSLKQMENALAIESEQKENVPRSKSEIRLLYYAFPLPEDVHALDIYHTLEERYGTEEQPFWAVCGSKGTIYYYMQEATGEDGSVYLYHHKSAVNLFVKGGYVYGLAPKNMPDTYSDEELNLIFSDYLRDFGQNADTGWYLDEEKLYWIDHEERITHLKGPDRSFVERRGIDENWEWAGYEEIMPYFGMFIEAVYEVPLTEDGPMLDIHLLSAAYPSEGEYRYYLMNFEFMDEDYHITVTDEETGRELQRGKVRLSIELPDTITFTDLNADGYVDMQIAEPVHPSSGRADMNVFASLSYMLWNPEEEMFERKTWEEVHHSFLANQNALPEEHMEYTVQPGDCLWNISERFLGSGFYWPALQREENAPENPNYLLPGETIVINAVEDTFDTFDTRTMTGVN